MVVVYACLWRGTDVPAFSAGQYDETYVRALEHGIRCHWPNGHHKPGAELAMITDGSWDLGDTKEYAFEQSWAGWWRRLEAFRPEFWPEKGERTILVDLDVILVGDCSWLGTWSEAPVGLPLDPFFPRLPCSTVISVDREGAELLWTAATSCNPNQYRYMGAPSEMALLRALAKRHRWPPLEPSPSRLLSYKAHVRTGRPWDAASMVYFHGKPKPHQLPDGDALKAAWRSA